MSATSNWLPGPTVTTETWDKPVSSCKLPLSIENKIDISILRKGSPLPMSIASRGLLKSRIPSSLRVRQHPAAAAPTDERQRESGRNKAAWAAPCPTSLLPLPEIRCNKIRCKHCCLTVWQTSPPSSLTIQPVSWFRLKLATLSHILVQEDEEEDIEIKGVPRFCWTRAKAE